MLGNGSSEVFDNIFRCFLEVGDEVIQHTPCFGIYKLRCNILGGKLVSVPMIYKDRKTLEFDADAVLKAVTPKTKIIVIANPNNPTGNFMDAKDFVRIAETGIPFVIDEAYVEYGGLKMSQVQLIKKYKNVLITRTLSKAYGLAGLRFGYALGDKAVIDQISAALLPVECRHHRHVGRDGSFRRYRSPGRAGEIQQQRSRLHRGITERYPRIGHLPFTRQLYPVRRGRHRARQGKDMVKYAEEHDLIFRPNNPMYDSEGWFRITIGTKDENRMAMQIIREFLTK